MSEPSGSQMAEAGFYYDGYSNYAFCFSCGVKWSNSSRFIKKPMELHELLNTNCPFITGRDFSIPKTQNVTCIQNALPSAFRPTEEHEIDVSDASLVFPDDSIYSPPLIESNRGVIPHGGRNFLSVPVLTYITIPKVNSRSILDQRTFMVLMRDESQRLETFVCGGWQRTKPSKEELAKAGFFHMQFGDNVQCAFCYVVIFNWTENEVYEAHRKANPCCKFIGGEEVGNIPIQRNERNEETIVADINCVVCLSHVRSWLFHPCKHCVCCNSCHERLTRCPVCRTEIYNRERIFLS
ncbi:IAP-3-like protein [Dinothrombium tinctorium]|uniref:IAP-3-like protein n=1 Tax=Dinothrombium tinctorium TaxID=1965070 RepID=A0A3S3NNQ0_9ACAR|nr:IAP-3-like protein [Dinothrombium tinctorium]